MNKSFGKIRMKSLIKSMVSRVVKNDLLWKLLDVIFVRISRYADYERKQYERKQKYENSLFIEEEAIKDLFPDLVVKHGIFAGMQYPELKSYGSSLFPKLLGSYEKELNPVIEAICKESYSTIVNIGCGEGYYSVGLAMRIPKAIVYAFDTNKEAISLCKQMAELNGVEDRVITGLFCNAKTLMSIPFSGRSLIFSDCEGYEKELFSEEIINALSMHDFLIEIHDFIDISISSIIQQHFNRTHKIEIIQSVDDIKKAQTYHYPEIESYNRVTRRILLGEYRPAIMEWFFLKPLDNNSS